MRKSKVSSKRVAAAVFGLTLLASFSAPARGDDLAVAPQVRPSATFTFKATVEATKPRLTLAEMAECEGMSQVCDEAYAVDFGQSPEPGKTLTLTHDKLELLLVKEWPDADVTAAGSRVVKVVSTFSELQDDEVLAALNSAISAQLAEAENFKLEIERLTIAKNTKLRPAAYRIEFPGLNLRALSGTHRIAARCIFEDGLPEKEFAVQVTFDLKQKLPVTTRALDKGEVIQASDLTEKWVQVGRNAAKFAQKASELVGRRTKRPAQAFHPLEVTQVEVPKIIKRGQLVKLIMKSKGLDVSGQVIAQGEGGYGQTLDAIYPATKKRLRVRVVDSSTVEYAF